MGLWRNIFSTRSATKAIRPWVLSVAIALSAASMFATPAAGQYRADHIPAGPPVAVPNPEIADKKNAEIPQDLSFTQSDGKSVKLGEFFNHNRPVVLELVYFSCPLLCGKSQESLVGSIRSGLRGLELGKDFDVVVVSIDSDDKPAEAATKRANYLKLMSRPESQAGFTYLTGTDENISNLAQAVGFGYRHNFGLADNDPAGKFAHSSGIFVCTPSGRLSQTVVGIDYPPDTLHNALRVAADGKIGGGLFGIALSCGAVRFNEHSGNYEHNPWFWAGTAGGLASMAFVAALMAMMWRGEWKHAKTAPAATENTGDASAEQANP
jgi:protein SCO1/2